MLKAEFKRLASGSFVYGIGGVLQRMLSILLLPLFTRVLTPEDYGVISLITLLSVGMTSLFSLGTGNSIGILYFKENDASSRPVIIWSTAVLLLFISALLVCGFMVFAPGISLLLFETPQYADLIRIASLSLAITTVSDPFYALLRMEERAKQYVVLTVISTFLTIVLSVLLVLVYRWGVLGVLLAALIGQATMLFILAVSVARKIPFDIDLDLFWPLVRIGFPSVFGLFAFLVIDYADRQMLQRMMNLEALGIYSIGYSFGMVMLVFVNAFSTAWPPYFMSFVNRKNDAKKIFGLVFRYYLIIAGVLCVLFFVAAKPLVVLLLAPSYSDAYVVVGMVAAAYMLKGCYLILLPGIYYAEKLQLQSLIEWIAAMINLALNWWWIPVYGIVGAAGATLVSYLALPILSWFFARKYLAVEYEWRKIGYLAIALAGCAALIYKLSITGTVGWLLLSSGVVFACLILLIYYFALESTERKFVLGKIRVL